VASPVGFHVLYRQRSDKPATILSNDQGTPFMAVQAQRHHVRDISVRLFRNGRGAPVLFLHGAGGLAGWLPAFDKLSAAHDTIVPEHPGFGSSDNPPWIRNVPDMAMYYLDFMDEMGLEGVHLVGHSLGGWIAAELAVRNATRLKSLTLLAPAGIRIKGVPTGDNFIWSPEETARNLFHDQSFAEMVLKQTPSEEEAERMLANRFMAAKLGWEPRWYNPDLERWLHRIRLPTLVLWGAEDKLLPARYAQLWGERVPHATVEIIPACGHIPLVEKTDPTVSRILDFIGAR
jgi:pimeloyl-ACP methyl ester carboxylesterase